VVWLVYVFLSVDYSTVPAYPGNITKGAVMQSSIQEESPLHDQYKVHGGLLDVDSNALNNRNDAIPFFHCLYDRMSQNLMSTM
jgi:hypothetical protein